MNLRKLENENASIHPAVDETFNGTSVIFS